MRVHIALRSVITDGNDRDSIVQHLTGALSLTADGFSLTYREPHDSLEDTDTAVSVTTCGATVHRHGAYDSTLTLVPGAVSSFVYTTPHGPLTFRADTRRVLSTVTAAGGRLVLSYTLTDATGHATAYHLTLLVRPTT